MKRLILWVTAVLCSIFLVACNDDEENYTPSILYSADDLAGEWTFFIKDNAYVPSSQVAIIEFNADNSLTAYLMVNKQWTSKSIPFTLKDNIISTSNYSFEILSINPQTLTLRNTENDICWSGEKVFTFANEELIGTWRCQSMENHDFIEHQITFTTDGIGHSDNVSMRQGDQVVNGTYGICNNFCWFEDPNREGIFHFSIEMGDLGQELSLTFIDSTNTTFTYLYYKVQEVDYTLDDMNGTWITTVMNGKHIPLNKVVIFEVENGNALRNSMENGKWVSREITLSLENNILIRTVEGQPENPFTILYFDGTTLILKNQSDGSIVTSEKILFPDENKDRVLGFWGNDTATIMTGEIVDFKVLYKEDSVYMMSNSDPESIWPMAYKFYGNVLVLQDETRCDIMYSTFGYDAQLGQRTIHNHIEAEDGSIITTTLYGLNLKEELNGTWLWWKYDDEMVLTNDLTINIYEPNKTTYIRFIDNYTVPSSYSIKGNVINYDLNVYPSEEVLLINDSIMRTRTFDNHIYEARRVIEDNPLKTAILGEWISYERNADQTTHTKFLNKFDANGMVTMTSADTIIYGSYQLYNDILVRRLQGEEGEEIRISSIAIDDQEMFVINTHATGYSGLVFFKQ